MTETTNRFDEAREMLENETYPRTDVATILDWIDQYEQDGYLGSMPYGQEKRMRDLFDVGVHVGFACGIRETAFRNSLGTWISQNKGNLDGNASEYARGYETCLRRLEEFIQEELG